MQLIDPEILNIAIIQSTLAWENPEKNLGQFEQSIKKLKERNINLVILPETFATGFTMNVVQNADAEGKGLNWMKKCAQENEFYLAGSLIINDKENYRNRLYIVSPEGKAAYYDKRHLFRMGRENEYFTAGKERVIIKIGNFRILLQICYDLRFPVFSRNRNDYDVMLYVANFPSARAHVWETLLLARAIENQAYVIGANSCGIDGEGVENYGNSAVIDMKGNYKARLNKQPGILLSSINLEDILTFRKKFPVSRDADNFSLQ